MKKLLFMLYFLGIIICIYLLKNYKSSSIADFSPLIYYAIIIVCFIAIIVTAFVQSPSGFIKNLILGISTGILAIILLFCGLHYFNKKRRSERIDKHISKVEAQKEFYEAINVLNQFEIRLNQNDINNKITSITASTKLLKDTILQNWKMKLIVFAKPKKNETLLEHKIFESEPIHIQFATTQKIKASLTINQYGFESLFNVVGDKINMEYLLLFTEQNSYVRESLGLDPGFAYTSLSKSEIKKRDGTFSVLQSRQYALFHNAKMLSKPKLSLTNLDIPKKEKLINESLWP